MLLCGGEPRQCLAASPVLGNHDSLHIHIVHFYAAEIAGLHCWGNYGSYTNCPAFLCCCVVENPCSAWLRHLYCLAAALDEAVAAVAPAFTELRHVDSVGGRRSELGPCRNASAESYAEIGL